MFWIKLVLIKLKPTTSPKTKTQNKQVIFKPKLLTFIGLTQEVRTPGLDKAKQFAMSGRIWGSNKSRIQKCFCLPQHSVSLGFHPFTFEKPKQQPTAWWWAKPKIFDHHGETNISTSAQSRNKQFVLASSEPHTSCLGTLSSGDFSCRGFYFFFMFNCLVLFASSLPQASRCGPKRFRAANGPCTHLKNT